MTSLASLHRFTDRSIEPVTGEDFLRSLADAALRRQCCVKVEVWNMMMTSDGRTERAGDNVSVTTLAHQDLKCARARAPAAAAAAPIHDQ